jgi:hypothetical protein
MTSELKIPFGRRADGEIVSAESVERGRACDCVCLECGNPLVARQGERNRDHFAHYNENCAGGRETGIHLAAKKFIFDALSVALPDNLDLGRMVSARVEEWIDENKDLKPDVICEFTETIAIEIQVMHPVPLDKIKKLIVRKIPTLEIDLSSAYRRDLKQEEWRKLVLEQAPRFWLYQPRIVRERIECAARYAAQQAAGEARRKAEADEARIVALRRQEVLRQIDTRKRYKRIEAARKRDEEFEQAIVREHARRQYKWRLLVWKQDRPLLLGLKICADTEYHVRKWERRKYHPSAPHEPHPLETDPNWRPQWVERR